MSEQKNKVVIAITLAIVSAFLLGGVSFTFFPSQTISITQPAVPPCSAIGSYLPVTNSSRHPLEVFPVFSVFFTKPLDSIVIGKDGSINSTTAPIKRSGNTYTLTGDITNQTIVVERNNIMVDGAGHSLTGFENGIAYALENLNLENVHGVTIKNFNVSLSWQGIWIQNCSNLIIEDNTLSNINTGVDVNSADNTIVTGNTFNNLAAAITYTSFEGFGQSVGNVISKNNITDTATGITLNFANSNSITDNIVVNAYDPIYAGTNGTVAGNTLINGIDAIGISSYNRIYDNSISNFSESGLLLSGINSTIYQNTVENCSSAVAMSGSSDYYPLGNNTLYHNNFLNNTQPLVMYNNASLSINYWDNGKEGNYWSSYSGTGANHNGIGDTPYTIGDNNTDRYPLMQPYVWQSANYDTATGQLFFILAVITAAVGAIASLCLYVRSKVEKSYSTANSGQTI